MADFSFLGELSLEAVKISLFGCEDLYVFTPGWEEQCCLR